MEKRSRNESDTVKENELIDQWTMLQVMEEEERGRDGGRGIQREGDEKEGEEGGREEGNRRERIIIIYLLVGEDGSSTT